MSVNLEAQKIYVKDAPQAGKEISTVDVGDTVWFYVDYKNSGTEDTGAFNILVKLDGVDFTTIAVESTEADTEYTVRSPKSYTTSPDDLGNHYITAIIDSDDDISENDESDNEVIVYFFVLYVEEGNTPGRKTDVTSSLSQVFPPVSYAGAISGVYGFGTGDIVRLSNLVDDDDSKFSVNIYCYSYNEESECILYQVNLYYVEDQDDILLEAMGQWGYGAQYIVRGRFTWWKMGPGTSQWDRWLRFTLPDIDYLPTSDTYLLNLTTKVTVPWREGMSTDFKDVRFTMQRVYPDTYEGEALPIDDDEDVELLPFYLEDYTEGVEATFWVRLYVRDKTKTEFLYAMYHKSNPADRSSARTTFHTGEVASIGWSDFNDYWYNEGYVEVVGERLKMGGNGSYAFMASGAGVGDYPQFNFGFREVTYLKINNALRVYMELDADPHSDVELGTSRTILNSSFTGMIYYPDYFGYPGSGFNAVFVTYPYGAFPDGSDREDKLLSILAEAEGQDTGREDLEVTPISLLPGNRIIEVGLYQDLDGVYHAKLYIDETEKAHHEGDTVWIEGLHTPDVPGQDLMVCNGLTDDASPPLYIDKLFVVTLPDDGSEYEPIEPDPIESGSISEQSLEIWKSVIECESEEYVNN